jgi:hypothetical protein
MTGACRGTAQAQSSVKYNIGTITVFAPSYSTFAASTGTSIPIQ